MENYPGNTATSIQVQTVNLFAEFQKYVSDLRLYYHLFQEVPCLSLLESLDAAKALNHITQKFSEQIVQRFFRRDIKSSTGDTAYWNEIFHLSNGILVGIESSGDACITYAAKQEAEANAIVQQLGEISKPAKTMMQCELQLIVDRRDGLGLESLPVPAMKLNLRRNFMPEAVELYSWLRRLLCSTGKSGLILVHGAPGTGKTSFLQYSLARQPRKVLVLSPDMATSLDKPSMTKLLCNNKGAVLLLEDAEDLIVSREQNRSSAMATLLNLSDGLIGRGLGIIIIASFNAPVKTIDPALLRKGRLLAMYEFQPLPAERATILLKHLGFDVVAKQPMTLADIYTYEIDSFQYKAPKTTTIGFRTANAG